MRRRGSTKNHFSKKPEPIPGVEFYTEGKGFTERTKGRVSSENMTPEAIAFMKKAFASSPDENEFDRRISPAEKSAKRILEAAGLPSDPSCKYSIPGGEKIISPGGIGGWGNLTALVEARGKRKREHLEWFAAEILIHIHNARGYITKGKAVEAAIDSAFAGELIGLAIAKGFFAAKGGRGKPPRRILELEKYIQSRRKDEDLTYKELKEELERTEDGDPIEWGAFQIWVNEGRVYIQKITGEDEEIKKARYISIEESLPRYWNRPPTRAK